MPTVPTTAPPPGSPGDLAPRAERGGSRTPPAPPTAERVARELDEARRRGPLQSLVIPPCPELLGRLREALAAAEPDLQEVARIAASDVAMAATLLGAANSAAWANAQPARTVGQALDRLGLEVTARRMTEFLVARSLPVRSPQLRDFWERSTERARHLAALAHELPGMSVDLAHSYGLFSHVGIPVLLQCVRGYGATLVEAQARIDRGIVATENANHRTDHAVAGALVARVWKLAPQVMAAIRLHHDLHALDDERLEPELRTLLAAGLVAEHLARLARGERPERDWLDHGERALRWLHAGPDDLERWSALLEDQIESV